MENSSTTSWQDLTDDCWGFIFSRLYCRYHGHRDQEAMSRVCKRLLAITNVCRTALDIRKYMTPPSVFVVSTRFPNLNSITINLESPEDEVFITQLAASSIRLRSLHFSILFHFSTDAMRLLGRSMSTTLTSLTFANLLTGTQSDLLVIADEFSYLRRLGFEGSGQWEPITDETMLAFSTKLVSLVSLTFMTGGFCSITRRSMEYLSSNCPHLSEFKVSFCKESRNIDIGCISLFRSLSSLTLNNSTMSRSGLLHLSRAGLKLEKLSLSSLYKCKVDGPAMCQFLKSCIFLRQLDLSGLEFSPCEFGTSIPQTIQIIVIQYLRKNLPDNTVLEILRSCPNLESLRMVSATLVPEDLLKLPIHYHLQHLCLIEDKYSPNPLTDEFLTRMCSIWPNLQSINIFGKWRHIQQGQKGQKSFLRLCAQSG